MNKVFHKARDKQMQQATHNGQAEQETIEQQPSHSHILLTTLEEAVNHFVASQSEELKLSQAKMRELHRQHPLWPEEQRSAVPHESQ
ncbi:hypothetical protein [Photobacterium salinisoli]|uniref:hypothetical protein n=1 Tax=Photobacterium salinisoli TaxID=1616783 RepID=UPI000EA3D94B|nr:hypothetical protein [Photobacterium salinisoli]